MNYWVILQNNPSSLLSRNVYIIILTYVLSMNRHFFLNEEEVSGCCYAPDSLYVQTQYVMSVNRPCLWMGQPKALCTSVSQQHGAASLAHCGGVEASSGLGVFKHCLFQPQLTHNSALCTPSATHLQCSEPQQNTQACSDLWAGGGGRNIVT